MKKIILILLTLSLTLPVFSLAQISSETLKEKAPGILAEWWNATKIFFGKTWGIFKSAVIKAWQAAVVLWNKMWLWVKSTWEAFIASKIDLLAEKIKARFR